MTKKRALLTLSTTLGNTPKEWLDNIEPKVERPSDTTCWLWRGSCFPDGHAQIMVRNPETGKRNGRRVARVVAEMFWELSPGQDVVHECGVLNCVNPNHFHVTKNHWTQEDRPRQAKKKQSRIRRYIKGEK